MIKIPYVTIVEISEKEFRDKLNLPPVPKFQIHDLVYFQDAYQDRTYPGVIIGMSWTISKNWLYNISYIRIDGISETTAKDEILISKTLEVHKKESKNDV